MRKFLNLLLMASFEERYEAAKKAAREDIEKNVPRLRYFKPIEFTNAKPSCSIDDMSEEFLLRLDEARSLCSVPFIITSAYRSDEYEKEHNRHLDNIGAHSKGLAVDIRCSSARDRLKIVICLVAVGFRRIGLYNGFIHVDMDISRAPSLWLG